MSKKDEFTDREKELYNSVPPADTMTPVEKINYIRPDNPKGEDEVIIKKDKYVVMALDVDDVYAFEAESLFDNYPEMNHYAWLALDSAFTSKKKAKKRFKEVKNTTSNAYLFKVIRKSEYI